MPLTHCALLLEIGVFVLSISTAAVSAESNSDEENVTTIVTLNADRPLSATVSIDQQTNDLDSNDDNDHNSLTEERRQTSVVDRDPGIPQTPPTRKGHLRFTKALRTFLTNNHVSLSTLDQPSVLTQQHAAVKNRQRKRRRRKRRRRKKKKSPGKNDRSNNGRRSGGGEDTARPMLRNDETPSRSGVQRQHKAGHNGQQRQLTTSQRAPQTLPTDSTQGGVQALQQADTSPVEGTAAHDTPGTPQRLVTAPGGNLHRITKGDTREGQQQKSLNEYGNNNTWSTFPAKNKQNTIQQTETHRPDQEAGNTHKERQNTNQLRRIEPTNKSTPNTKMENHKLTRIKTKLNQRHGFEERLHPMKSTKANWQLVTDAEAPDTNKQESKPLLKTKLKTNGGKTVKKMQLQKMRHQEHNADRMKDLSSVVDHYSSELSKQEAILKQIIADTKHAAEFLDSQGITLDFDNQGTIPLQNSVENAESGAGSTPGPPLDKETNPDEGENRPSLNYERPNDDTQNTERHPQGSGLRQYSDEQGMGKGHQVTLDRTYINLGEQSRNSPSPVGTPPNNQQRLRQHQSVSSHNRLPYQAQGSSQKSHHIEIDTDDHNLKPDSEEKMNNKIQSVHVTPVVNRTHTKHHWPKDDSTENRNSQVPRIAVVVKNLHPADTEAVSPPRQSSLNNVTKDRLNQHPFIIYKENTVLEPQHVFASDETIRNMKHLTSLTKRPYGLAQQQMSWTENVKQSDVPHNGGVKDLNDDPPKGNSDLTLFKQVQPTIYNESTYLESSQFATEEDTTNHSQPAAHTDINKLHIQPLINANTINLVADSGMSQPHAIVTELLRQFVASSYLTKQQQQNPPAAINNTTHGLQSQFVPTSVMAKQQLSQSVTDGGMTSRHQSVVNSDGRQPSLLAVNRVFIDEKQHHSMSNSNTDEHLMNQPISIPKATSVQEQVSSSSKKEPNVDFDNPSTSLKSPESDDTWTEHALLTSDNNADNTLQTLVTANNSIAAKPKTLSSQEPDNAANWPLHPGHTLGSSTGMLKTSMKEKNLAVAANIGDHQPKAETKPKQNMYSHHIYHRRRPLLGKYQQDKHSFFSLLTLHNRSQASGNAHREQPVSDDQREISVLAQGGGGPPRRVVPLPGLSGMESSPLAKLLPVPGAVNSSAVWIVRSGIAVKPNHGAVLKQGDNFTSSSTLPFLGIDFISYRALVTAVGLGTTLMLFCCFLCVCSLARWHRHRQYRKAFNKLQKGFSDLDTDKPFYIRLARLRRSPAGNQFVVTIVDESKFSVVEHDLESEEEIFDVTDIVTADKKGPLARLQWTNQNVPF